MLSFVLYDLRKMLHHDLLGGLALFGQSVLVHPVQDGLRFPPAVEHDIFVWHSQGVKGGGIVMPEVVESEQGEAGLFEYPPQPLGDLLSWAALSPSFRPRPGP